jgi:uncharacterized membrane protein
MAGFFATYSFNVNYATSALNGEMYATVQSLFNVNVRHFGFFLCFFGAGVVTVITGLLLLVRHHRDGWKWLILGICYTIGIILFTKWVNLPLNYYTESWDVQNLPSDWQAIRESWNQANLFRTWWNGALFLMAGWLLSGMSSTK